VTCAARKACEPGNAPLGAMYNIVWCSKSKFDLEKEDAV